jgi:3-deoxy-D-manno-octulosonic-acid transferase
MILFFYNLALLGALLAGSPWWLWRMATTQKYREGMGERLGRVPKHIVDVDPPRPGPPVIWLHAVSVGEILAIGRLVAELDRDCRRHRVMISTTTRTGQALARERFGAGRVFYCPLDLPWAVRAYLNALRPRMLILAETEFWPNLLNGCFRRNIPVAVVNARISDRSWPRYQMLGRLWKPILSRISRVLAQTETDADRLRALGCRTEIVTVAGNLKFDVRATVEAEATRLLKAISPPPRFLVAGSTLEGEEAALIAALPSLAATDPALVMVLAPRHPERFGAVAALLEVSGLRWIRRSAWTTQTSAPQRRIQVVLLDTIGELASVYSIATVALVGGSLVPAGGHNPLEPAQFGVPIVMGPHYANFRAITEDLLARQAIRIATRAELAQALAALLTDPAEAKAMGGRARQVFDEQAGATGRCVQAIRALLEYQRQQSPASAHAASEKRA